MNIITQFSSKQNLSMLWDVLLDELHVSTTNKQLVTNIKLVFDSNIKPFTSRINPNANIMDLNKHFLHQVVQAVNKLFPKDHNNIQRITITNEEVLEPYKIEDIQASRQSEFEKEVIRKQHDLENYMTPKKPKEVDFSDKMLDSKITSMDSLVAEKLAERNQELELLQNTNYNTNGISKDKWLSSVETSVKGEKLELRNNELTNNHGTKLKHINIDNNNNIVLLQKEKKVSWSNNNVEPIANIFQKLKKKPEEFTDNSTTEINMDSNTNTDNTIKYVEQKSTPLPEVKRTVINRVPNTSVAITNTPIIPTGEIISQMNEMNTKINSLFEMVSKLTKLLDNNQSTTNVQTTENC